jgi:hypothetical protein
MIIEVTRQEAWRRGDRVREVWLPFQATSNKQEQSRRRARCCGGMGGEKEGGQRRERQALETAARILLFIYQPHTKLESTTNSAEKERQDLISSAAARETRQLPSDHDECKQASETHKTLANSLVHPKTSQSCGKTC